MKATRFAMRAILAMAVAVACALTVACGAGPTTPPAPIVAVSKSQNPLVANVTVMTSCAGQAMVEFGEDTTYGRTTSWYPVSGNFLQSSILVAGMKASTLYHMRAQLNCGGAQTPSQDMTFTTGPLPALAFPTVTVSRPNSALSTSENPGIESVDITIADTPAFFTDRDGNPIWYYDNGKGQFAFPFKMLANGHMLLNVTGFIGEGGSTLTEVDLAGNVVRSLNIFTLQHEMATIGGFDLVPQGFHHDFVELPNGHIIALVDCNKNFTNLSGYPGTTQVVGDGLVDLDQNWNPVWAWNSFDYVGNGLDINRHLGGLPDWTHGNAILYSPEDGNLLFSMRQQSWVVKIDYNNGGGTGNILWHLGYQGDFALTVGGVPTDDPSQWFSFQHFPIILSQNGSETTLGIWDNGNDRVLNAAGAQCINPLAGTAFPSCYSRPLIFQVDESSMVANIAWADQLPYFGIFGGNINQFSNGNVEFDLNDPAIPPSPSVASQVQEITTTGTPQVVWQMNITPGGEFAYRALRVPSLYNGVTWLH